jgi:hypothetical protein
MRSAKQLEFDTRAQFTGRLSDLGTFLVGIYEHSDGSGHSVELQRAEAFDDQDRETGMATYAITVDASATVYGGVDRYEIDDGVLRLELDPTASSQLGISSIEVRLDADIDTNALDRGIQYVLTGEPA